MEIICLLQTVYFAKKKKKKDVYFAKKKKEVEAIEVQVTCPRSYREEQRRAGAGIS